MTEQEIAEARARNPFAKGTFNLTRQFEIMRVNPKLATELKKAVNPTTAVFNPWLREQYNLTSQMEITKEDPEAAKVLKAQAEKCNAATDLEYPAARGEMIAAFVALPAEMRAVAERICTAQARQTVAGHAIMNA